MRSPFENQSPHKKLSKNLKTKVNEAAALLKNAAYAVILTGAGSSTPSGIPDFRSPRDGLWSRYSLYEFASLTSFRYNPEKFFNWFHPLASLLSNAKPNSLHTAITTLENRGLIKSVITQNIDQLHDKAGSKVVIEIHGSLKTLSCIGCFSQFPSDQYISPYLEDGIIPHCPLCHQILKPDVVLYEEQLPVKPWSMAKAEVEQCDLMIVAGSSLTVTPACELPMLAKRNKARLIIINLTPTYIDNYADVVINEDVSNIFPAIAAAISQEAEVTDVMS